MALELLSAAEAELVQRVVGGLTAAGLINVEGAERDAVLAAVEKQKQDESDEERFGGMASIDCSASSCFSLIRWDPFTQKLWMRFRDGDGTVYEWWNFPRGKFTLFRQASSKGRFYWDHIEGRYQSNYGGREFSNDPVKGNRIK